MALRVRKTIITDSKSGAPVAVQVPYEDWLDLERRLKLAEPEPEPPVTDLTRYQGALRLNEDPLAFQRRNRDEWP